MREELNAIKIEVEKMKKENLKVKEMTRLKKENKQLFNLLVLTLGAFLFLLCYIMS